MSIRFFLDITPQRLINKELPPHYIRLLAYLAAGITIVAALMTGGLTTSLWWKIRPSPIPF